MARFSACRITELAIVSVELAAAPVVNWLPSETNRFATSCARPNRLTTPKRSPIRQAPEPFLNLQLLADRGLTLTYVRSIFTYTAFYLIFYGLPVWLEQARGYGPTSSGLIVLPIAVLGMVSTVLATRLERHRGPRPTLFIGTGVLTAGGLLLMLAGEVTPVALLLAWCAVLGLPNGFNSMATRPRCTRPHPPSAPAQLPGSSGPRSTSARTWPRRCWRWCSASTPACADCTTWAWPWR